MAYSDYKTQIENAQKRIQKATEQIQRDTNYITGLQQKAIYYYVKRITVYSKFLDQRSRETLFGGLEALVENSDIIKLAEQKSKEKESQASTFNPKIARSIREKLGLSQVELAKKIGLKSKHGSSQICKYESGLQKPGNPPKGECSRNCLGFLKRHGYDPFGI